MRKMIGNEQMDDYNFDSYIWVPFQSIYILFQTMEKQDSGKISLKQNYGLVSSNSNEKFKTFLENLKLTLIGNISIELIMMHKKAVECVQSYLDNSDSNVCSKMLKDTYVYASLLDNIIKVETEKDDINVLIMIRDNEKVNCVFNTNLYSKTKNIFTIKMKKQDGSGVFLG